MKGGDSYGITNMPVLKAIERLADLVIGDLEECWRDADQDPDEIHVTVTRVFNEGAAVIAGHWDEAGAWVGDAIYIDDDQQPWDVLIRMLADVTKVFPSDGRERGHCICLSGRQTTVHDLIPMLRKVAYGT